MENGSNNNSRKNWLGKLNKIVPKEKTEAKISKGKLKESWLKKS